MIGTGGVVSAKFGTPRAEAGVRVDGAVRFKVDAPEVEVAGVPAI